MFARRPLPPRRSIPFCPTYFQQLTNCLKFDTLSLPFYFQQLPTVKFCNSLLLITIRNAREWVYSLPVADLKFYFRPFTNHLPRASRRHSPLTLLFATDPRNPQLSSFLATHPKTLSRKSFACHTCDPSPPLSASSSSLHRYSIYSGSSSLGAAPYRHSFPSRLSDVQTFFHACKPPPLPLPYSQRTS